MNFRNRLVPFLVYWPILTLPLILGGARTFLWSFIASVFVAGFAVLLLTSGESRYGFSFLPASRFLLLAPGCLLLPIIVYPFLQVIPLPLPLVSVLSPQRALWLYRSFEATGASCWWASLSYAPFDTLMTWLWILTLALFALVLHRSMRDGTIKPGRLLSVIFAVAGLEALYGIIQVLVPSTGLGFHIGRATGTFANSDHYAAFLGMIWPLQLVWLLKVVGQGSWVRGQGACAEQQGRVETREKRIFFTFLTGIVLLALIFSGSRGGIISVAIGTTVLVFLGGKICRPAIALLIGCWVVILAYGSIIGFEGIVKRFAEIGQDAPGRFKIWQFTWRVICDHWLTGTGAGTYSPVIFLYQVFDTDLVQVGHAHNDYLQIASECGVPLSLFIFSLVWGYWWLTASQAAGKKDAGPGRSGDAGALETNEKIIRVGALAGSASFLSHIWVEFNWQIPANQLYFVILLVLMSSTESSQ